MNSAISELANLTQQNLSNFVAHINAVKDSLDFHVSQLQSNLTQINNQLQTLQEQVRTVNGDTDSVSDAVARIQTRLSTVETNYNAINLHFSNVQTQLNTTQTSVSLVSSQLNSFHTLINNRLNNQVNLYQNCRQDRATCIISMLTNENRRVYCSTNTLSRNITVRYSPACLVHLYYCNRYFHKVMGPSKLTGISSSIKACSSIYTAVVYVFTVSKVAY